MLITAHDHDEVVAVIIVIKLSELCIRHCSCYSSGFRVVFSLSAPATTIKHRRTIARACTRWQEGERDMSDGTYLLTPRGECQRGLPAG
jgi:hypothetical protein